MRGGENFWWQNYVNWRDFETFTPCLNAVKMTSLLNDEKCVKFLAVCMHDFVHKPMGIYLVMWYLK